MNFPVDGAEHRGVNTCVDCAVVPVPATSLDAVLNNEPVIDLLKIDAEGGEPDILRGASASLARGGIRTLLFELHDKGGWARMSPCAVVQTLDEAGFDCFQGG